MKAGWKYKPLGELCDVIGGGTPPKDRPDYYGGDIPWATVRDMRADIITSTEYSITAEAVKASATNIIPAGNVVIATRVGLGKVCLLAQDTAVNQDLRGIVPKSNKEIDIAFLFAWFKSISEQIIAEGTGATVQGVKLPFIKGLSVPLPTMEEQRRIVTLLDEAFADIATAKANAEKNLQNAREIFESQLQFIFKDEGREWPVMPLEKVASIVNGFAFKSGDFTPSGETKCIKITNVGVREFACESDGRLPKQFSSKFTSVAIPAGSIVMALTRTIISSGLKVAVVPSDYNNALLNQRVAAILPCKGGVSMSYLFAYLSSQAVAKYVSERVNTLMQPNLSIVDLRSMPIPTPSFSQQEKITELIALLTEETHRLESIYRQKLTVLDDLKKSLLHQAFSGQL